MDGLRGHITTLMSICHFVIKFISVYHTIQGKQHKQYFCISDDICVPDGGFKSNALIQAVLTILFRLEEFKGDGDGKGGGGEVKRQCREVTVFME
jgi:hypothetical protein